MAITATFTADELATIRGRASLVGCNDVAALLIELSKAALPALPAEPADDETEMQRIRRGFATVRRRSALSDALYALLPTVRQPAKAA